MRKDLNRIFSIVALLAYLVCLAMPIVPAYAANDVLSGVQTGTGAVTNVSVGFRPVLVIIHALNATTPSSLVWQRGMANGAGVKTVGNSPVALLANEIRADLNKALTNTVTWNPAAIGNSAVACTNATVPGAALGDHAFAAAPYGIANALVTAYVNATSQVSICVQNQNDGIDLDLASGDWRATVMPNGTIGAVSNAAVTNATAATRYITTGGITIYNGSTTAAPGFTLGTDADVNVSGVTWVWTAFRRLVGSY